MASEGNERDVLFDRTMDADQHVLEVVFDVLAEHEDHDCGSMEHLRDAVANSAEAWAALDRAETREQFEEIVKEGFEAVPREHTAQEGVAMAEKKTTSAQDDLASLLGEGAPPEEQPDPEDVVELVVEEPEPLKGVDPKKGPPWGPEMFATAAYRRSQFGAEWNDQVAEADDETIAETFALASRLLKVMRAELASRLTQ